MRKSWDERINQSQQQVIEQYEGNLAALLGMIPTLDAQVKMEQPRGQFYLDMQAKLLADADAMTQWRMFLTLLSLSGPDRMERARR